MRGKLPLWTPQQQGGKARPPSGSPEIPCSVLGWVNEPTPILDITCPASDVISPIRLFLRMSWEKAEQIPAKVKHIVAGPDLLTKVRIPGRSKSAPAGAAVKLPIRPNGHGKEREEWFTFNDVKVSVEGN